jgi:hypothetical protein
MSTRLCLPALYNPIPSPSLLQPHPRTALHCLPIGTPMSQQATANRIAMPPPHSHSHSPYGDEYHDSLLEDSHSHGHGHSPDSDHGHVHHHRPASTKVPVNFFIALLAIQLFVTPLFVFCRMYMLRKQRATIWSKIADWCFGIYGFLVIVDSGTMMNYVVEEKKLIEKFPGVQDEAKVLNEMLKKSHLVVSYHPPPYPISSL